MAESRSRSSSLCAISAAAALLEAASSSALSRLISCAQHRIVGLHFRVIMQLELMAALPFLIASPSSVHIVKD